MSEAIPSKILCVHADGKRAALVMWWGAWLPCELNPLYLKAVEGLRVRGHKVMQTTNFQGDGGALAVRRLLRKVLMFALRHRMDDIVTIVSPHSTRGYRTFRFADMLPDDPPHVWDMARDTDGALLPTRLIRLDLRQVSTERMTKFMGTPPATN